MSTQHEVEWTDAAISRFWDYQSKRPSIAGIYFSAVHSAAIARRTARWLRANGPARVLDMGCGTGAFLRTLSQIKPELVLSGGDFSAKSIDTASRTCASVVPPPELKVISGYPTAWERESFDAIYLIEVVEHLADAMLDSVLGEAIRLLKPGAHLIITTPNDEDLERQHTCCPECGTTFHIWQHVRNWNVHSLSERLAEHGYRPVTVFATFLEPLHVRVLLWIARKLGVSRRRPPNLVGVFQKAPRQRSGLPTAADGN